jgi:hypothetical protein
MGNIVIFPLSQGIYPAGFKIYPKQKEISIDLETVVSKKENRQAQGRNQKSKWI